MDTFSIAPVVMAVIGIAVVVLLAIGATIKRIHVAGPNEAFIVTGRKSKRGTNESVMADLTGQKVVMGASVFVLPFVQQLHTMDLSSRRIPVSVRGAVTKLGVKVDLEGVAIVKVGGNEDLIRSAAQRFLQQQDEIVPSTQEVLSGALRSIVGSLTVEEIIRDRAAFANMVADASETSLTGQGLVLDTFQIQDVRTEGSYLNDLGRPEQARASRDAQIAEAQARQRAEEERLLAEEAIAVSERQLALKRAEIQAETDAARARADASGPLAEANRQQEVLAEQEKVAEREAALRERRLDTEVRRPADAERYRVEQDAEARRNAAVFTADAERQAAIAAAQAEAERARLVGEGERSKRAALADAIKVEAAAEAERLRLAGEGERTKREALAEAIRAEGAADADAVRARGDAEASAIRERADAFSEFGEAAVLEMLIRVLPDTVAKASEPMGNIDNLTVISTDGASKLPAEVANNVHQGVKMLADLTGVDIPALITRFAGQTTDSPRSTNTDDTGSDDLDNEAAAGDDTGLAQHD